MPAISPVRKEECDAEVLRDDLQTHAAEDVSVDNNCSPALIQKLRLWKMHRRILWFFKLRP